MCHCLWNLMRLGGQGRLPKAKDLTVQHDDNMGLGHEGIRESLSSLSYRIQLEAQMYNAVKL
jgi:hypothetical protein